MYRSEITYKGVVYPTVIILTSDDMHHTFASKKLWDDIEILVEHGDKEATCIDEGIFYYIPKRVINSSDDYVRGYIEHIYDTV